MQSIAEILARELEKPLAHVQNVINLLDEGNTIPFIARYRKELHGSMDDTALRTLEDRLNYLRNLAQRREEVKNAINGQGKLTQELSAAIDNAATLAEVEDLYRPYKQKRRTRATVAREKGLEPLAQLLLAQGRDCPDPETAAAGFLDPEKGVETLADALQGANDIVAELLSDDAAIRKTLRELLRRQGRLRSPAATEEDTVYRLYYDFDQPIAKLAGHQILAINRGEKEGVLTVTVLLDRELGLMTLRRAVVRPGSRAMEFIKAACEDAYDRLIYPSLEREARSDLTAAACEGAIANFGLNLKPLLMQPPVKGHVTMGLDPGYAHGCKVAVIDGTGRVLDTAVVYPTFGPRQRQEAIARLSQLVRRHGVTHIAIGNGTASRETEQMAVELIRQLGGGVSYCATCDAPLYRGKTAAIIGFSPKEEAEADFMAEMADKVYYIPMYADDVKVAENVEVLHEKPISVEGTLRVQELVTDQGSHAVDGVFFLRDSVSPKQLVPGLKIENNHIPVDRQMRTNLSGCFACGDVTGPPYQYIKSAGEGNVAALSAVAYLAEQKRQQS